MVHSGAGIQTEFPLQFKVPNRIRTTKYTAVSWAPLSLLNQFTRAANIYFLIISVLTCMPFSPKVPAPMLTARPPRP